VGRLDGKSALITGAGAGIGAAIAKLFCAEGAAVTLVDMDEAALNVTRLAIQQSVSDARIQLFVADIGNSDAAQAAVKLAILNHGHLDTLINNAAMRNNSALSDATPAEGQTMLSVN